MANLTTKISKKYYHLYPEWLHNHIIDIDYLDLNKHSVNIKIPVIKPMSINDTLSYIYTFTPTTIDIPIESDICDVSLNHTEYYITHLSPLGRALNGLHP